MAKELAQTMGSKRIGLLIAVLAAFAVLATMGNQWLSKSASAVITSQTISCETGDWTGGQEIDCTTVSNTDAPGDFTVTTTVPGTTPVEADSDCNVGEDATDSIVAADSITCVYDGPANTTATFTAIVDAQENCSAPVTSNIVANSTDGSGDTESDTLERTIETPCLSVDKLVTVAGGTCTLPCSGTYTIIIENTGDIDATGVGFVDELDDRLFVTSVATDSTTGSCDYDNAPVNGPQVTCSDLTVDTLDGNIEVTIAWTMSSSDIPIGDDDGDEVRNSIDNTAPGACVTADNVEGEDTGGEPQGNLCTLDDAVFTFGGEAAATLTKVASPSSVASLPNSQGFTWIYQIINDGTVPLTSLVLTDGALDGGVVGSVTADGSQPFTGSLLGACVITGQALECDFDNGGTGDGDPILQLNPGESVTVTVQMHTVQGAAEVTITNTAELDAEEFTGDPVTAVGTVVIDNDPLLTITKTLSGGPTVGHEGSGDPASFVITISNVGGQTATGVTLVDALPAGLELAAAGVTGDAECVAAGQGLALNVVTIAAGDTITCNVAVQLVDGIVSPVTSFLNTATLDSAESLPITASASVEASVPSLTIVKTSTGTISADNNATYTITVTNTGTAAATNVDITDLLPAGLIVDQITCPGGFTPAANGCINGTIALGASVVVTIEVELDDLTIDNGTVLTNIASASADNTATVQDTAETTVASPNLTVTKTNSPTIIGQGGIVTSTIVVTNNGNEDLDSVTISDNLDDDTTYVVSGSSASCSDNAGDDPVVCTTGAVPAGGSATFVIRFNVGDSNGIQTNVVTANGYIGEELVDTATATASVTVVEAAFGGLVHVDVDAAAESAAHDQTDTDENQVLHDPGDDEVDDFLQDDVDDATGSMHTVCLLSSELGTDEQGQIQWNILPTPGSSATVSPAGGTKSILDIDDELYSDDEANCVSWRSAGVGGQTITATDTLTGAVYYFFGDADLEDDDDSDVPLIKEWNDIDSTKIVSVLGDLGGDIFGNTQELSNWTSGTGCIRDWNVSALDVNCVDKPNLDGTEVNVTGSTIVTGGNAGNIITGQASFIEYAFGNHADYSGTIDGVQQTFTVSGCGSVLLENPVTGEVIEMGPGDSETIINSDKGVGFQIFSSWNGSPTNVGNADCAPGESTTVSITSTEDVQLRSDIDGAPTETITVNWLVAPPPQKKILLAWAGQRVILEHDWRISPSNGLAYDVDNGSDEPATAPDGTICPIDFDEEDGGFWAHYIRGTGPGNFLPSLGVYIEGNDDAEVWVDSEVDQWYDEDALADGDTAGNENCISRVLYESEDPGEVDIEAFIDYEDGANLSKIAFVIYYMKFESIELSIVDQVSKPNHNAPSKTVASVAPYDQGDYAPGNPWDVTADNDSGEAEWNVSRDLLIRGRVKGWFNNSNPSGRLADASNTLNVLPANRWVMPDDWDLLAGGPGGEEVKGTAEEFRPGYDIMIAPNNVGTGTGIPFLCDTPWGGCSETLSTTVSGTTTTYGQTYNIVAPVEGPYSLLDLVGPLSAALSNIDPTTVRNTIIRDGDVDWWDAPMPSAPVSISLRESGFLKQVQKEEVYWTGTTNGHYGTVATGGQDFTNPFYFINVPDSAFIPAVAAGGGFLWDSFGPDGVGGLGQGAYEFWTALPQFLGYGLAPTNVKSANSSMGGVSDTTLTTALRTELAQIRVAYGALSTDSDIAVEAQSIGRDLVVFIDNHGEFMVQANGDFNLTYADCDTNIFGGGRHCADGDVVGGSTIVSTVDYPDFRGKHFPVKSNSVSVDWTWGGYKEVTIEDGETDQFKYIVFRALDRDGFCSPNHLAGATLNGAISLHPVLSSWDAMYSVGSTGTIINGTKTAITALADVVAANAGNVTIQVVSTAGITAGGYLAIENEVVQVVSINSGTTVTVARTAPVAHGDNAVVYTLTNVTQSGNDPIESVDFLLDAGEGIIVGTSGGGVNDGKQFATGVTTYSTLLNVPATSGITEFAPLNGGTDECQAWIRVSNSLLGILDVLVTAHDDEGDIGFDRIIDFSSTASYELTFRWSLITWAGQDGISPTDALKGTVGEDSNDIFNQVTAVYGWNQASQTWLGFFPAGVSVPGANDLTSLENGQAYWIAIKGPGNVTWTIETDVN